jgi:hypothetical protein
MIWAVLSPVAFWCRPDGVWLGSSMRPATPHPLAKHMISDGRLGLRPCRTGVSSTWQPAAPPPLFGNEH